MSDEFKISLYNISAAVIQEGNLYLDCIPCAVVSMTVGAFFLNLDCGQDKKR